MVFLINGVLNDAHDGADERTTEPCADTSVSTKCGPARVTMRCGADLDGSRDYPDPPRYEFTLHFTKNA